MAQWRAILLKTGVVLLALGLSLVPIYWSPVAAPTPLQAAKARPTMRISTMFAFPQGGRTLFPSYRFVALYGTPGNPVLGALGDQPLDKSLVRVRQIAAQYQPYSAEHIYPTFEIITTIASSSPTANGDYSQEVAATAIRPWVIAAQKAGVYVVLDLQSGRTDFLTQAKEYEGLLKEPNVGLALDPEWRLTSTQVPLMQIGTVDTSEINRTATWLATLIRQNKLPQKLFLLHQFQLAMITNRDKLDTAHPELAYAIQMDGQGTQPMKQDTWRSITAHPPANVHFGWKNFYHKDSPTLSPKATMEITPKPWYISYQ